MDLTSRQGLLVSSSYHQDYLVERTGDSCYIWVKSLPRPPDAATNLVGCKQWLAMNAPLIRGCLASTEFATIQGEP
jgi:hypothetical protein